MMLSLARQAARRRNKPNLSVALFHTDNTGVRMDFDGMPGAYKQEMPKEEPTTSLGCEGVLAWPTRYRQAPPIWGKVPLCQRWRMMP
jgi:hypothetical protein